MTLSGPAAPHLHLILREIWEIMDLHVMFKLQVFHRVRETVWIDIRLSLMLRCVPVRTELAFIKQNSYDRADAEMFVCDTCI